MNVHSWIFRNRARLRLIYGTPKLARLKQPESGSQTYASPGTVQRRARYVLLHPMGQQSQ